MPHYGLYLSDMRVTHFGESDRLVAHAARREDLLELLKREKVQAYQDFDGHRTWTKTFRKHGPLEWCNDVRATPPRAVAFGFFVMLELGGDRRVEQIYTLEEYVEKHRQDYKHLLDQAYDAGALEVIEGCVVEHLALPSGDEHGSREDGLLGQEEEQEHGNEEDEDDQAAHGLAEEDHRDDDREGQDDAGDRG